MYVGVHGQLAGNGAKLTSSTKKITILGALALAVVLYNQNTEILSNIAKQPRTAIFHSLQPRPRSHAHNSLGCGGAAKPDQPVNKMATATAVR